MNSHIVEKTMHSIKNIDRLTDLAAIDVYNTTHDTINKYEIMKEHATEEYTNESFYQESVLAGVLIGAGVLGVAISAFFIIKKIIDSKDSADSSVKSSDGKMVAAQVDLTDPKSTEKYLTDLKARLEKLTETKSIKVTKSINKDEFAAAEKQINDWSDKLQEIIDNKHEAAAIEKIIDEITISSVDASKIFVDKEMDISVADFVEALGLRSISSFAGLLTSLKKKIDDVEKMVNNKKDKEAENAVQISQDHLTKLKNQNNDAAKLIAALKSQSKETLSETDKVVLGAINAETEAKKTEEPKPTAGTGSDTPQNANPQAQSSETATPVTQNSGQNIPPSSTPENLNFQSSGFKGGQSAEPASQPAPAANSQASATSSETPTPVSGNQSVEPNLGTDFLNAVNSQRQQRQNENLTQQFGSNTAKENSNTENWINAANANNAAAEAEKKPEDQVKTEPENSPTSETSTEEPSTSENSSEESKQSENTDDRQIIDEIKDLIKANNSVTDASILLRMMSSHAKATDSQIKSCTAIAREELKNEPQTEVKSENQEDKNKIDNRQIIDEIKGLLKSDPFISDSDLILKIMTKHVGATSDQIKSCIAIAGEELKAENPPAPTDQTSSDDEKITKLVNELYRAPTDDNKRDILGNLNRLREGESSVITHLNDVKTSLLEQIKNGQDLSMSQAILNKIVYNYEAIANEFGINVDYLKNYDKTIPTKAEEPKKDADEGASKDTQTEKKPEDQVKTEPENSPTPTDQNTGENTQETTPETSTEESETKPEGEGENLPAGEGSENDTEDTNGVPYNVLSAEYLQSLLNMPEQSAIEAIKNLKDEDIERMIMGIPKNIFVQLFENAASALATISPATYLQQLTDMLNNNAAVNKIKALLYQIKQGDRTAFPKLKTTNFKELAELTDGRDVSDYITSILPRVKSAFDSLVNKYKPEMLKGASQIETRVLNIEQNVVTFFNFIKDACKGLVNKDKALNKVNDMESSIGQLLGKLDPNFSYGDAYSQNEFGNNNAENKPDPFARQRRQGTATAPAQFNPSAPADWNDRMNELGKAGIPNKQVPEPKTAPTPLNPAAPQEWNDNMNALKSAGAENISQKTEVPPIAPIDTNADIEKAKAEKAQLDALQQHRQEQLAQLKAERAQREQQVRDAYAQDAQARQNAVNEELAKQSQEDEQKKAQASELTKANEEAATKESEANVAEAIRQAEEEKKALEEGKNLSVSPQSTEGLDNAAKKMAMQDFINNFKDPAWREAHPDIESWQELYNSDGYKNEAIMKIEAERIKNEKLADNRAGIQFIKEQNYEAIVPSLDKVLETTSDLKTITRYLDGLKTTYAKILTQYQQNPGNARKIIEDYSKNGAAPYEFNTVPYNEIKQTQLVDWQQKLFSAKVELDKDRRRNRKKIKMVDEIIDKLIELDELLKTSVHNVIAVATKNPMRALEAALVMFQEGDEEIIAGLTAIEDFINKADEVKASEEEADKTPENPAEEPSDEEVSQSILSILKS